VTTFPNLKKRFIVSAKFLAWATMLSVVKPNEKITFVASFRYVLVKISLIFLNFILSMVQVVFIAHLLVRYLIAARDIE
jgi:hypothetical protein